MKGFAPLSRTLPYWPEDLLGPPPVALDMIGVSELAVASTPTSLAFAGKIAWLQEIEVAVPAINGASFALLDAGAGFTEVGFNIELAPNFSLTFGDLAAEFRFVSDALKPVKWDAQTSAWVPVLDPNNQPMPAAFKIGNVYLHVDGDGQVDFVDKDGNPASPTITPPALQLGGSGIVLDLHEVKLYLSEKQTPPDGAPAGFKGVTISEATLHLGDMFGSAAGPETVTIDNLMIGSSGFSGTIGAEWDYEVDQDDGTYTGDGLGELFGLQFGLKSLKFVFSQNRLTGSGIKGVIKLPFFDRALNVEVGYTADGGLTVGIDSAGGLGHLSIPKVLELELDSLKFDVDDGVLTATISGKLTPTVPGFTWPAIDLKDLKIDSKGNVQLPGGWLDLPKQYGFNFHGFKVDITKFGMGRNEDGTKWIGFSGGVKLVDGLPMGASVDGLRITADPNWTPSSAKISFDGVGVELDAKAFHFKGAVSYREFKDADGKDVHRFDGDILLKLRSPELKIDGSLVIGSVAANEATDTPAYNFFAIYVGVDLPTGIPLAATGLAFYGFEGLLAIEMAPNKEASQPWYAINAPSWYNTPTPGVADLKNKWKNARGSKAFGAGVTLGTYADNGYTFNGKVLFAIVFPGPIILIEGMVNLLKDRAKLTTGDDPDYRALAVIDNRPEARSLLIGLDVRYQYDKSSGTLIKISAGTEAYYKFDDPSAWHIYLGIKEPREQRIQADILSLFKANAYLMLNAHELAMGAWVGYDKTWSFPPLSVTLQAWMESNVVLSFRPAHLHGDLWVHGAVDLKAFGFGLGLIVDARLAADVFHPFVVVGDFEVELHLPWPLSKKHIGAHVKLQWGPRPKQPPIPAVLKDVAIESFKTSTKWPLPASPPPPMLPLLKPNYADADGFLLDPAGPDWPPEPDQNSAPPTDAPIVPLDCRPSISFARNVNDDALVGAIVQPLDPEWEQIGDPAHGGGPARIRYGLEEVRLDKWDGSAWQHVAGKGGSSAALPELFGTWAPVPGNSAKSVGQNKLLLWSTTGFDHVRHTGAEWSDWFGKQFGNAGYPCLPATAAVRIDDIQIIAPGGAIMFAEDFDGVTAPALPAGWTTAATGSQLPWVTSPTNPDSAPNDAFAPYVSNIGSTESELITPEITLQGSGTITLTFKNLFNMDASTTMGLGMDPGFDGMVLEISIDRGPFLDITSPSVWGRFVEGGYLHNISSDFGSPIAGRMAWSGVSAGTKAAPTYITTTVTVAIVSGQQNIRFKWRVVTDNRAGAPVRTIPIHNWASSKWWSAQGNVLEPYTNYRLRIVTTAVVDETAPRLIPPLPQLAYFQTKGPPGLSTLTRPSEPPYPDELVDASGETKSKGGLDDLTLYVDQTIPPTVPKTGEQPLLPRPVYRGYDVGVRFKENYVDLMYRLAGRDLALLLYDRNNQPVREQSGRLAVLNNPWGVNEKLSFNDQEAPWISLMNGSPCIDPIDLESVPRDQTLQAAGEAQILDPDTLYDARLMPLLLHEDFSRIPAGTSASGGGSLGRWRVSDLVGTGAPSHWQTEESGAPPAYRVIQTSGIGVPGTWTGTLLALGNHPGLPVDDLSQPPEWSDYRLSLSLRSHDGAIGVAFRYVNDNNFYLFTMDRPNGAHRLLRVTDDPIETLAEDQISYEPDHDYHLVIEAIGDSLRIYLDETLLFDVTDTVIERGGLALQCSNTNGAAFSEIQVHDFSKAAKNVYHFSFTTSEFVDFFHHAHSFDDECWLASCTLPETELAALRARSTSDQNSPILDDEARAFERLADNVLQASANQLAARTEMTRIKRKGSGDAAAFLLRTSEPIDWARTSLAWAFGGQTVPSPLAPGTVKLVAASLGAQEPGGENITLLVRDPTNLTGYRIEKREMPVVNGAGPPALDLDDPASTWISIYEFGSENVIAPGTQIVVNSGNPDNPPPAVPRVLQRFRAPTGAPGDVQLAGNTADLRLLDSQGAVVHARRFLNSTTSYNPVNFHVLRKADGTAFFLLPAGFPGFLQGTYQMTMNFRRDNTAVDPDSLVLSAAGQKTTETVVLDVPWQTL
jgi:hypothetical protein